MNEKQYEALCKKAEKLAETNPSGYKRRLIAFSYLGHAVLFGLLACLIAILVGTGAIAYYWSGLFILLVKKKVAFLVLPLIWLIARALWVKFEKPTGQQLTREEFPELFSVIDELQSKLKTPKIHQVLLTEEFNASIAQTPRLGILGWQHNTLTLGLSLLMTLTRAEARSVIAHELGHLSGSHSAFSARIYRSRIAWGRLMQAMGNNDSWGGALIYRFFTWYAPRFSAYSFALARQNEYEADTIAANLTSPRDAANALVAVHAIGLKIDDKYWHPLYSVADHIREPDSKPWHKLKDFISINRANGDVKEELKTAMAYTSDYGDTHPSLTERLANLNMEAQLPVDVESSAAQSWFGDDYSSLLEQADQSWMNRNREQWKDRFDYVKKSKERMKELESASPDELTQEQMWEKVALWGEFKSNEDYMNVVENSLEKFPGDTKLRFIKGRSLIEQGQQAGLKDLEAALDDDDVNLDACLIAYYYLVDLDQMDDAELWREKAEHIQQKQQELFSLENSLNENDTLRNVRMTDDDRESLKTALKDSNLVKKAWIAEKETPDGIKSPVALTVVSKKLFLVSEQAFMDQLRQTLPEFEGWIFMKNGESKDYAKKVCKIKDRLL